MNEILIKDSKKKKGMLFEMLKNFTEPSLIYMSSPLKAYNLAKEYRNFLKETEDLKVKNTNFQL